jgi:uncharacterized membrane protein
MGTQRPERRARDGLEEEETMRKANGLALVLMGVLVLPGSLLDQHEQHHAQQQQEKPQQGMMGQGMMGQGHGMAGIGMMSGPGPEAILAQKDALGLSDAQVERLKVLVNEAGEAREKHLQEVWPLHRQAQAALAGDTPDLAAYESAVRTAAEHEVALRVLVARQFQQALDVLSPEQRSNVRYGIRLMHGMMGGGMMGGMMHGGGTARCPMMGEMGMN